jgi:hypothetical protein
MEGQAEPRKAQEQPYQNLGLGVRNTYSWSHGPIVLWVLENLNILESEYLLNSVNLALRLENLSLYLWPLPPISCSNPYGQTSLFLTLS